MSLLTFLRIPDDDEEEEEDDTYEEHHLSNKVQNETKKTAAAESSAFNANLKQGSVGCSRCNRCQMNLKSRTATKTLRRSASHPAVPVVPRKAVAEVSKIGPYRRGGLL